MRHPGGNQRRGGGGADGGQGVVGLAGQDHDPGGFGGGGLGGAVDMQLHPFALALLLQKRGDGGLRHGLRFPVLWNLPLGGRA